MLPETEPEQPTELNPYSAPDSASSLAAPPAPRPWGFWATAGLGVAVIGTFVLMQSVAFLVAWFVFPPDGVTMEQHANDGDVLGAMTLVSGTAALLLIALFAMLRGWNPARYVGLQAPVGKRYVPAWIALTAGLGFVHSYFAPMLGVESPPEFMIVAWTTTDSFALLILGVSLMAPLFEETFFRGFLFAGWAKSWMGVAGTAVLTSLLWTVIHIQYGWYELSFILILGILLVVARHQTRSLWTPLLMHAVNNSIAMVGMAFEMGA